MGIQKSILALNPLAYYPLQETAAGTISDLSGNGLHGTTGGGAISFAQAGGWAPWPDQKLMTFPRTPTGNVSIANFPSMGGSHTYTFWVRRNNNTMAHQSVLGQQGALGNDACCYLKIAEPGSLDFLDIICVVNQSAGTAPTAVVQAKDVSYPVVTNTLYFRAVVVDLDEMTVTSYLNGSVVATATIPAGHSITPGKGPMYIGALSYGNSVADYAGASMAHVAFFDRALTPSDIARLYSVAMTNTGHTKVTGTVRDGLGAGVARVVRVYARATGKLLGETTSASDGSYTCHLYGGELEEVYVVALDDDAAPDYNAAIIDRQIPVGV